MTIVARARNLGVALVVPVLIIVVWWFASANNTSPFYPSLEAIVENFRDTWLFAHFESDVIPSLKRFFFGYLVAVVAGIGLGVLFGRLRTLDQAFQPTVQFLRAMPATGLVPVVIAIMGIGDAPKIWLIGFTCMFPVLLNTIDGVRGVDRGLEDVARTFRLTRRQRIFSVQLPAAAPQIFAGMRISLAIAFIIMVVTEMVGSTNGIGFMTLNAQQAFQVPLMWSGMMLLAILGASVNVLFLLIERRVLRWHYLSTGRET